MMAEAIWYFADGDEERGPVTEAQIRTLIGTGNLRVEDLVWKEGMDDWMPAGEVPGLFEPESDTPVAEPKREPQPPESPAPPASASPQNTAIPRRPIPSGISLDVTKPFPIFKWGAFLGQPLLLIGFLVVLMTRGCDSLADRYVDRVVARAKVMEDQFNDDWDARKTKLERQREQYQQEGPEGRENLQRVNASIDELDEARQEEEAELRQGKWRDVASAARDAEANRDMWRFWREAVFWLATGLFAMGLLILGFTGHAAERWLSLVMLAVIVYAMYVTM